MNNLSFDAEYMKRLYEETLRSFAIPASMFYYDRPVKFTETVGVYPKKENNVKYIVEKFSSNTWKEVHTGNTQGQAMNWSSDIKWSTGPEGMKFGIDAWNYLYRIVEKKEQWMVLNRRKNDGAWMFVVHADSITEGTRKVDKSIIWASVNDQNECYGIHRDGTAYKVVRNE